MGPVGGFHKTPGVSIIGEVQNTDACFIKAPGSPRYRTGHGFSNVSDHPSYLGLLVRSDQVDPAWGPRITTVLLSQMTAVSVPPL